MTDSANSDHAENAENAEAPDDHDGSPDIAFTARVSGRRLRWHDDPQTTVSFDGSEGFRSRSDSDRVGLPKTVRARHTYRDVTVDYRLECALPESPPETPPDSEPGS
ncbi:hypothetical protein ACWGPQ_11750 [Saccharomonospora azurea]